MKRSNIILIAFSTLILIVLTIFFVDARKHILQTSNLNKTEVFDLPDFNVVVVTEGVDVQLLQSDTTKLVLMYDKNSHPILGGYRLANDTLYLINCSCPMMLYGKNWKHIIGKQAQSISLSGIVADTLKIDLMGDSFDINDYTQIKYLDLKAFESECYVNSISHIGTLAMELNSCNLRTNETTITKIERIKLTNNTFVHLKIRLKKENESNSDNEELMKEFNFGKIEYDNSSDILVYFNVNP